MAFAPPLSSTPRTSPSSSPDLDATRYRLDNITLTDFSPLVATLTPGTNPRVYIRTFYELVVTFLNSLEAKLNNDESPDFSHPNSLPYTIFLAFLLRIPLPRSYPLFANYASEQGYAYDRLLTYFDEKDVFRLDIFDGLEEVHRLYIQHPEQLTYLSIPTERDIVQLYHTIKDQLLPIAREKFQDCPFQFLTPHFDIPPNNDREVADGASFINPPETPDHHRAPVANLCKQFFEPITPPPQDLIIGVATRRTNYPFRPRARPYPNQAQAQALAGAVARGGVRQNRVQHRVANPQNQPRRPAPAQQGPAPQQPAPNIQLPPNLQFPPPQNAQIQQGNQLQQPNPPIPNPPPPPPINPPLPVANLNMAQGGAPAGAAAAAQVNQQILNALQQHHLASEMMVMFPKSRFSGKDKGATMSHWTEFDTYITYQNVHNNLQQFADQLRMFRMTLTPPASEWATALQNVNNLQQLRDAFLQNFSPWGTNIVSLEGAWNKHKFDLAKDDIDVWLSNFDQLALLAHKNDNDKKIKLLSLLPPEIQLLTTHLADYPALVRYLKQSVDIWKNMKSQAAVSASSTSTSTPLALYHAATMPAVPTIPAPYLPMPSAPVTQYYSGEFAQYPDRYGNPIPTYDRPRQSPQFQQNRPRSNNNRGPVLAEVLSGILEFLQNMRRPQNTRPQNQTNNRQGRPNFQRRNSLPNNNNRNRPQNQNNYRPPTGGNQYQNSNAISTDNSNRRPRRSQSQPRQFQPPTTSPPTTHPVPPTPTHPSQFTMDYCSVCFLGVHNFVDCDKTKELFFLAAQQAATQNL